MSSEKMDRRKKYTRMVLKESLMKILKVKPISSITVKEICEVADINRSTYYSHFQDQYDLLKQIEDEFIEDMNITLHSYDNNKDEEALQMIEQILLYVSKNRDMCETLFSDHGDISFKNRIMTVAYNHSVKNWVSESNIHKDVSKYGSLFAISGCISVIESWLSNGMDKPPKEMANIIFNLTKNGIDSFSE
ncbi:TetR-like C-terminal domain-containing protein [Evansella sp. AB-P1]|uniref:TetR/AcrR family transcriptional regulator n=1 Tax=Evansella sp. AB-P1 TaxID=3037653 RepID=UPI0024202248|nr:TetR-like C-terminal domain-containing protein [Evansella sp. AB-P1]MDG5788982.1 TetR-like C-terminal domain-containing protein [Evansella sp. AB-P1]